MRYDPWPFLILNTLLSLISICIDLHYKDMNIFIYVAQRCITSFMWLFKYGDNWIIAAFKSYLIFTFILFPQFSIFLINLDFIPYCSYVLSNTAFLYILLSAIYWNVKKYMEIQCIKQQHFDLIWPILFFKPAWTLLADFLAISSSSLQE